MSRDRLKRQQGPLGPLHGLKYFKYLAYPSTRRNWNQAVRKLYLTPDEAAARLLAARLCDLESLPDLVTLENWLTIAQAEMDNWLKRCLLPTEYEEFLRANHLGTINIPRSPLLEIRRITMPVPSVIGRPRLDIEIPAIWGGGQSLEVGGLRCSCSSQRYKVTYLAGYDPLPPIVPQVMFNILRRLMIGIELSDRTRHLTNVGLQGGISQTFELGKEAKGQKSSTNLDDLMSPLERYQKKLWF